ncbi:MAG: hypothetical protein ACRDZX_04985, partial [Acidimicrobiales bacterium]
ALKLFAATGKSFQDLAALVPESRLERIAAALILVPPAVADPAAEALYARFGPRPPLLAAATRFAPMVATARALEWSARLRSIGIVGACPLLAQARIDVLDVADRIRAAVTAHAAFGDGQGAELALALAPGVHLDKLGAVVKEVSLLDPALSAAFAQAAAGPGAEGAGPVGPPEQREQEVAAALGATGVRELSAQSENYLGQPPGAAASNPQLATLGADR